MRIHAGCTWWYGCDILTLGSMHAKRLLWSIYVLCLVLIAQAVFLLECRQTNRHTDVTERPTEAGGYTASVGN